MALTFNTILLAADFHLADVRLLRHQDTRDPKARSPYQLWREDRQLFELYQRVQNKSIFYRSRLAAPYWASFVGTPNGETMFVGIYSAKNRRLLEHDTPTPQAPGLDKAGSCDEYDLALEFRLSDLIGRLIIDWGSGYHAWIQRADQQDKQVIELRAEFKEPAFPGFLNFIEPLSRLDKLPATWIAVLKSSKGIYLLACPRTKEQYVGSATGTEGFWGRWQEYILTGHAGDVALKSREPSDYQVAILEVAGTASSNEDIRKMESQWKLKLQSREMGLNRN